MSDSVLDLQERVHLLCVAHVKVGRWVEGSWRYLSISCSLSCFTSRPARLSCCSNRQPIVLRLPSLQIFLVHLIYLLKLVVLYE